MDRFEAMRLFVSVADTGSFTKAAIASNVVQSTVSKQIAALEARLGVQLLRRTSRGLSLTGSGEEFYVSAIRLIDDFEAIESSVGRDQIAPSGVVRVAMSAGLGRMYIVPRLREFLSRYPDVTVDLDVSERHVNLVEDSIDVAIRIGPLMDSTLMARRIGSMTLSTVATPSYLEAFGEPETPRDLQRHAAIVFMYRGAPRAWMFRGPRGTETIMPKGPVRTNDAEHIRAAVREGLGIGHNPSWLFAADVASGSVRRILGDYAPPPFPIHAVSPGGRLLPAKVKVFIDFLAEICAKEETLRIR